MVGKADDSGASLSGMGTVAVGTRPEKLMVPGAGALDVLVPVRMQGNLEHTPVILVAPGDNPDRGDSPVTERLETLVDILVSGRLETPADTLAALDLVGTPVVAAEGMFGRVQLLLAMY